MLVQLERIPSLRRRAHRPCSETGCLNAATWFVVDREIPSSHAGSLGEVTSCAEHISSSYLRLRGAAVMARATSTPIEFDAGRGTGRRRTLARATILLTRNDVSMNGST